jgi:hypothetical protein
VVSDCRSTHMQRSPKFHRQFRDPGHEDNHCLGPSPRRLANRADWLPSSSPHRSERETPIIRKLCPSRDRSAIGRAAKNGPRRDNAEKAGFRIEREVEHNKFRLRHESRQSNCVTSSSIQSLAFENRSCGLVGEPEIGQKQGYGEIKRFNGTIFSSRLMRTDQQNARAGRECRVACFCRCVPRLGLPLDSFPGTARDSCM